MDENVNIFKFCSLFVFLCVNLLLLDRATSVDFTVGDDELWDTEVNFNTWAHKYNFSTGDVLVFKYVKGQHNVYEVEEDTYKTCDASSGVLAKYESGNDSVKLSQARKYWFICNVDGHCLGGMRFGIDVNDATNSTNNNSTQVPPPPISNSCSTSYYSWTRFFVFLVVMFGILLP